MQESMYGYCWATLARDTTAAYSLPTDEKCRKLWTERSSLESIHKLLRVSTKRVSIGVKTVVLARNFLKSARKSLDGRSHSSVVASSTRLKLSMLDVYE